VGVLAGGKHIIIGGGPAPPLCAGASRGVVPLRAPRGGVCCVPPCGGRVPRACAAPPLRWVLALYAGAPPAVLWPQPRPLL